jgi:hypothetical protein
VFTLFDILCNPFPIVFRKDNVAHVRMRSAHGLPFNLLIYIAAVSWNVVHLPETLSLRFRKPPPIRSRTAADAV